jgi:hypothetical protein
MTVALHQRASELALVFLSAGLAILADSFNE